MPPGFQKDFSVESVRILLIDDNSPFVLPLIRSFSGYKNIRIDLLLLSSGSAQHFKYSRYLGKVIKVQKLDDGNMEAIIKDAVLQLNTDILLPTREWISLLLFKHRNVLETFVSLHPLPDSASLHITGDKWNLNQWLKKQGFPHARCSKVLDSWSGNYPALIKPVFGIGGKGIRKVENPRDLNKLLKTERFSDKDYMIQEFIEGFDIDVSFLANKGRILYHTIQKSLISRGMTYSKGIEFVLNEELLTLVSNMINKLNYTGIAHLDFRFSSHTNEYILIDFNSRYWSSVQGSRAMGINFPLLVLEWMQSGKVKQLSYRTGSYYFSTTAFKIIIGKLFGRSEYQVKLKDTQLKYIFMDPLPEFMFLMHRVFNKK